MNICTFSKISIISDTHFRLTNNTFKALIGKFDHSNIYESKILDEKFPNIKNFYKQKDKLNRQIPNLIIHAGDIGNQDILNTLQHVTKTIAVTGNCDFMELKINNKILNDFEYIEYKGIPIAVSHVPNWLEAYIKGSFLRPSKLPKNCKTPILKIHGHTHESHITINSNKTVTICPGSATQGRYGSPNSISNVYIASNKLVYAELIQV